MKVLFVSYGPFDCNSGGHIARFAQRLHARGHAVAVAAEGPKDAVREWGPAPYALLDREALHAQTAFALAFDGRAPVAAETVVMAWTPRECVRTAVQALRRRAGFHTVVHLEDDERLLTAAHLGRAWSDLACLRPHELDPMIAPSLTHPHRMAGFLAAADGVTAIAPPLLTYAPGSPAHVLRPGCDPDELPPPLRPEQRRALLERLGVPAHHRVIVYPGNLHAANRREMFSLYVAVQILRRRGIEVTLVRTGEDFSPGIDVSFDHLRGRVSRELGRLPRRELLLLLRLADLFVQPGAPDAFNRSRLPSKLPELFATGRPVLLPCANLGLEVRDEVEAAVLVRGDGVEIADRAEPLLRDEPRAAAMGAAGRRWATRTLDWDRSTDGLERFLSTLTSRPRRLPGVAA
jgi:glycosyltransferase involved in cell wall biosynthesis